ncbi:MAG: hypothetical protein KDA60_09120, partial [Planctomycetales bacterium]|nr:hypothetical protein [Planctomycetales bacterium]
MVTSLDLATDDISNSRLKLRTDLLFSPRRQGSEDGVHIEDSRRGKHFYVGYSEYAFLSQFDGQTAFAQALTIVARKLGPAALSKAAATDVFHWLLENELAYTPNRTRRNAAASSRSPAWWRRLNPFWLKVPLGNPDALLGTMVGGLGWLFSVPAILATVIAVIVALLSLAEQWDRFSATAQIVFAPMNWLWMAVAWALLKIVHELGHGIACKRLGGEVREAGVVFILLAPLTYVDVTSSWRCASKWQRIGVAAAGMYVELIVALCAYFAWQHTDSELAGHLLYNVVLMASVMTLVFNVNPLMRFDGYYILADWLEIPNLYSEASLVVREHLTRLFWGRVPIARRRAGMTRSVLAVYGWSAVVWRIVVCASLSIVAGALWAGAGIVLVGGALVGWLGMPAYLVMREVWRRWQEDRVSLVRAGGVLVLVGSTGWAMLLWTPNPLAITAPGVVEFEELKIVRSATPGFVDTIHVEDGEWVAAGTPLITLRNDEVTNRRRDLELEIEQARIQERIAVEKGNSSEIQVVRRDREALESRLA